MLFSILMSDVNTKAPLQQDEASSFPDGGSFCSLFSFISDQSKYLMHACADVHPCGFDRCTEEEEMIRKCRKASDQWLFTCEWLLGILRMLTKPNLRVELVVIAYARTLDWHRCNFQYLARINHSCTCVSCILRAHWTGTGVTLSFDLVMNWCRYFLLQHSEICLVLELLAILHMKMSR